MKETSELFDLLFSGLVQLDADRNGETQRNPLLWPSELRHATNRLALHRAGTYPKTITGLFTLLSQPLDTWYRWPAPDQFDTTQPLMALVEHGQFRLSAYAQQWQQANAS